MNDNFTSIIFATIILTGAAVWLSQRVDPAPNEAASAQLSTAKPNTNSGGSTVRVPGTAANEATIRRENDGHYWTRADVDGSNIKFLVDTGASVVALNWNDAKRLRIDLDDLTYNNRVSTAGGQVMAASVVIERISIGNVEVKDIDALIMQEDLLENSLLGMSFLGELYSYEFKGNTMIIRE